MRIFTRQLVLSMLSKNGSFVSLWIVGVMAGAGFIADRLLKAWALSLPVGGGFFIEKGLGLGFFQNAQAVFGIPLVPYVFEALLFFVGIFLVYAALLAFRNNEQQIFFGLLLILIGGGSNMLDRFQRGFVVDYVYAGPAVFNLADAMIATGFVVAAFRLFATRAHHYPNTN